MYFILQRSPEQYVKMAATSYLHSGTRGGHLDVAILISMSINVNILAKCRGYFP